MMEIFSRLVGNLIKTIKHQSNFTISAAFIIATADGGEVNVVDSNVGENTDGGDKAGGDVVSVGEGGINGTDIGGDNITAQAGGGGGGGGAGAGGKAGASGGGGALGGQGGPAANTRPPIVTVCPPVC
ncbi:hypothetical protein B566_EDAN017303, partial [Ephemera danica]